MEIISAKTKYEKQAIPSLRKSFGYANKMAVPKVEKMVVNVGIGRFLKNDAQVSEIMDSITLITGQRPVYTKTRKAIAGFKIRQGLPVGIKVTLRGKRMWQFMDRIISFVLPRVRDFQGIKISSVDSGGNLNIGFKEQLVFPEISAEKAKTLFGLQVTISTTARSQEEARELFRQLGFPLSTD